MSVDDHDVEISMEEFESTYNELLHNLKGEHSDLSSTFESLADFLEDDSSKTSDQMVICLQKVIQLSITSFIIKILYIYRTINRWIIIVHHSTYFM